MPRWFFVRSISFATSALTQNLPEKIMLTSGKLVGLVPTTDFDKARLFMKASSDLNS
jgi:hypothetical protein